MNFVTRGAILARIQPHERFHERLAVRFGVKDPQFGQDVSLYVFRLPFLTFVVDWLFAAFVIILIITAVAYYLNGGKLWYSAPAATGPWVNIDEAPRGVAEVVPPDESAATPRPSGPPPRRSS